MMMHITTRLLQVQGHPLSGHTVAAIHCLLLQLTVGAGLSLWDIAQLVAREEPEEPSQLEEMVAHAAKMVGAEPDSQQDQQRHRSLDSKEGGRGGAMRPNKNLVLLSREQSADNILLRSHSDSQVPPC